MDAIEAAGSVYRLANSMIYDLLHKQTVEKGLDPREYAMFSSGGTAAMHMPVVAPELGVRKIVVPHSASVHGAFGLVSSDVVYTDAISLTLRVPADAEQVNDIFATLAKRVTERLLVAGFNRDDIFTARAVNMRYRYQVHVIPTPIDGEAPLSASNLDVVCGRFETLYAERYGKEAGYREAGIEMVAFHIRGIAQLSKPRFPEQKLGRKDPAPAYIETRDCHFGGMRPTRCYDFERLAPGNEVAGPAIIWTPITTIVVPPEQRAACDAYKNIVITW
jgi:N-methylhydantoinase A